MANTVGLDDPDDNVAVLEAIEESFALKISDAEAEVCETLGDMFDLLRARFADQPGACMTSMAFYRLRRALADRTDARVRPDAPLAGLVGRNPKTFLARLKAETGLRMPPLELRGIGCVGTLLVFSAFLTVPAALFAEAPWPWIVAAVASFPLGVMLVRWDPGRLPKSFATLGDLAAWAAPRSYGRLAGEGGAVSDESLWGAMTEVFAEVSDLPPNEMRRDTWVRADRPKAA